MAAQPFVEDAPRHEGVNFYYAQEDLIKEYAQKNKWNYSITRPNLIVGVSKGKDILFAKNFLFYYVFHRKFYELCCEFGNLCKCAKRKR